MTKNVLFLAIFAFSVGSNAAIVTKKAAALDSFKKSQEVVTARQECRQSEVEPSIFQLEFNDMGGISTYLVIQPCHTSFNDTVTSAIITVSPKFDESGLSYQASTPKLVDINDLNKK